MGKSKRGDDALKRVNGPFFEGDGFEIGFESLAFEGETIFTADEVEDGRRNEAMKDRSSYYAEGRTRSQDQSK